MQIKLNENFKWSINAKKVLTYGLAGLGVAYVILGSLPASGKIAVVMGVVAGLINLIKQTNIIKPEETPISTEAKIVKLKAKRK